MTALLNPFWYGAVTDPSFASVVLLLHFDGANTSTTLVDSSLAPHTFTNTNQQSTSQQMFGTASLFCSGASTTTPDSADWAFGSGQFTVECWIRPTATITGVRGIVAQASGSTDLGFFFGFNGTALIFQYSTNGTTFTTITGTYVPTTNAWSHIAVDRDASNVVRVYGGGAVISSATAAVTFFNSTRTMVLANDGNGTRAFSGFIDEVRITKGVARYGGAFTPPTTAFPDS